MERRIDFWCDRRMLCGGCGHEFVVDLDWIDRWEQSGEKCASCGLTCEHEDAPPVTVDPNDPALDDAEVARFAWYHTSTQPDWPTKSFDPAAVLTLETRMRMGGDRHVAAWAERQRSKALHVGTYEAAIHNMLRRMHDQADHSSQFYLYRVHLKATVVVREGWLIDPSNFVGDVALDDVCPPCVDVARYLNYHEDPGGLSLALGRDALASVQQVAVPIADAWDADWVRDAVAAFENASDVPTQANGGLGRLMRPSSPRDALARALGKALTDRLPVNLRDQFISAERYTESDHPERWARRESALFQLIVEPGRLLSALDRQERRRV
ncbi:hypothetical protein [Rathayibacter iranicus]|uniref:hypothetical protein n=1 Tax=Rathayibacter iranicus TaxID=59737 RepID=UPI000CE8E371|nr:hypothetical protein [Rathayibacter iranicus]PPI48179.1 hypothetical protein C5E09_04520 [Rathayibacter iranicus]